MSEPVQVECAYCGIVLTEGAEPVSHGICEMCLKGQRAEVAAWKQQQQQQDQQKGPADAQGTPTGPEQREEAN